MRRSGPPLVLSLLLAAAVVQAAEAPAGAPGATFDALAKGAVKTQDVATLLAPFIDASCGGEMRELDRARCRSTTAFLRRQLPKETFRTDAVDPAAIAVSGYDAAVKGYHIALAGCLACTEPMPIGSQQQPRYVTLEAPDKAAPSLAAGVPIAETKVTFDDFAAAKRWAETERPFLRAEFLFQAPAEGGDFTVGMAPGIALKMIGARIYNRCTGAIVVSKPPSTGFADRPSLGHEDPACAGTGTGNGPMPPQTPEAADELPDEMSKAVITQAMEKARDRFYGCYQKFHAPGALVLTFAVGGNGTVQSIQIGSTFNGTPTGACATEIAKDLRFPAFKHPRQSFRYLYFLRKS